MTCTVVQWNCHVPEDDACRARPLPNSNESSKCPKHMLDCGGSNLHLFVYSAEEVGGIDHDLYSCTIVMCQMTVLYFASSRRYPKLV